MEEKVNMFSCLRFVPRGSSITKIEKVKHKREELENIIKEMKLKEAEYLSRPEKENKVSKQRQSDSDDDDVENMYDLDTYDDEISEPMGLESLILDNPPESNSEDSDAEENEFSVKPGDNMILAAHVTNDVSMLEVYVFNHENAEFFLLHDIYLPSFPLSLEWLDFNKDNTDTPGNFSAVGYISNEIDIWDLTVTGSLEPVLSLSTKKSGKGKRHTKAIMDLSWNRQNRNILGSSSADKTVRLWDMNTGDNFLKLDIFEEKVQTIDFHRDEAQNILTGDCSGCVKLFDCRSPGTFKSWVFEKEIEKISWNKFDPYHYFASTNTGMLHYVDIRSNVSIWTLYAHEKEVTGFSLSSECADMLVTVSMDESVKVWDLKDHKPHQVTQKQINIGEIYTIDSCPDVPYVFCIGGKHKENPMYLWDSRENTSVIQQFQDRMGQDFLKFVEIKLDEQPGPSNRQSTSTSVQPRIPLKKKPRKVPRPNQSPPSDPGASVPAPSRQRQRNRRKMHPKTKDKK